MRAVNLLPSDTSARKSFRKEDPAVVVGSALGVVVLIALVAGFMNVHAKVNSDQQKLTAVRSELAQLSLKKRHLPVAPVRKPGRPIIPVPAVTSEEAPRLAAISTAMSTRIAWDRILREFSLVLPSDVTLTSLTLAAPPPPAAAGSAVVAPSGTQGLNIAGTAFSNDGVARLMSRLELIPDLTNVTLAGSQASSGATPGVTFTISADIKGAPAPVAAATPAPTTPASTVTTSTGPTS